MLPGFRGNALAGDRLPEKPPAYWGLCFTAEQAGSTVSLVGVGKPPSVSVRYTVDDCATWSPLTVDSTIVTLPKVGSRMYLKAGGSGNIRFASSTSVYHRFALTGRIAASGDLNSLLSPTVSFQDISGFKYRFARLFYGGNSSVNQNALTTAPDLCAHKLGAYCYYGLFQDSKALRSGPRIFNADIVAESCFRAMFAGCTSLAYLDVNVAAWTLKRTVNGITNTISSLAAFTQWLNNVASSGVFRCPTVLGDNSTIERGVATCPKGWTVENKTTPAYYTFGYGADPNGTPASSDSFVINVADETGYGGQFSQARTSAIRDFLAGPVKLTGHGALTTDSVDVYLSVDGGASVKYTLRSGSPITIPAPTTSLIITNVQGTVATETGGEGGGCVAEGTRIFLAGGGSKAVEDIGYGDELLVWDHSAGRFSSARPSWIMEPYEAEGWFLCTFLSGRTLCTCGAPGDPGHRLFDLETGRYEYERDCVGHRVRVVRVTGAPDEPTVFEDAVDRLVSVERVDHPCRAYNVITEGGYNAYAEGVLTSCRLSNGGMTAEDVAAYWARLEKARRA